MATFENTRTKYIHVTKWYSDLCIHPQSLKYFPSQRKPGEGNCSFLTPLCYHQICLSDRSQGWGVIVKCLTFSLEENKVWTSDECIVLEAVGRKRQYMAHLWSPSANDQIDTVLLFKRQASHGLCCACVCKFGERDYIGQYGELKMRHLLLRASSCVNSQASKGIIPIPRVRNVLLSNCCWEGWWLFQGRIWHAGTGCYQGTYVCLHPRIVLP